MMVPPNRPTNAHSTNPNTCPKKFMTILLSLLLKVEKCPRFSGSVNPAASAKQIEHVRTDVGHGPGGVAGYLAQIGCTCGNRRQQQLDPYRTHLRRPIDRKSVV